MAGYCKRRQGIDEAGGEAPEAAVAQAGVRLFLDQRVEIPALLLHRRRTIGSAARFIMLLRSVRPEQELHRQVVDALGIGLARARVAS